MSSAVLSGVTIRQTATCRLQTAARAVQQLAWQARLPEPIAAELFSIADGYDGKGLSDEKIALLSKETMASLRLRFGAETDTKVAQAQRLIQQVGRANPVIFDLLGTGLGSDLRFVTQMVMHADRLYGGNPK